MTANKCNTDDGNTRFTQKHKRTRDCGIVAHVVADVSESDNAVAAESEAGIQVGRLKYDMRGINALTPPIAQKACQAVSPRLTRTEGNVEDDVEDTGANKTSFIGIEKFTPCT